MSKHWTKTIAIVAMLCMVLSSEVMGGPGSGKKKMGFFAKIGHAIKKASHKAATAVKNAAVKTGQAIKNAAVKTGQAIKNAAIKTGHAIKTAGAKVANGVMDSGVWAKQKIFGKKNKVWVCGHYDKNGKWTKGHWRKLEAAKPAAGGNTADQSNTPSQESAPATDNGGYTENTDAGMAGDGVSNESENMPVAGEDPVLPELGNEASDQSEQAAQEESGDETAQSGEAAQGNEMEVAKNMSLRTMGMLMNDIVDQSKSITDFRKTADPNISYSMDVQADITTTYEVREGDARLLVRVIVWDLQQNNGQPGKYYSFFLKTMKTLDPVKRQLIKDVSAQVREGVVHGMDHVNSDEEKAVYNQRLEELAGY